MKNYSLNILLVEDNAIIAFNQKRELEKHGYAVIHVISGEKAIENVKNLKEKIDLVLMDIDLGKGIDGTQTAREILKLKEIPIVFLSSHTESEIVQKTESITSYGYVVKNSGIIVLDASIKMAFKLFNAHKDILKHKLNAENANREKESTIKDLKVVNESLIRLDRAIKNSNEIIFITNKDGIITYINPQFTKTYGYSKEETLGKISPIDLSAVTITGEEDEKFWETLQNKHHLNTHYINKTKDGKIKTVETSIDPIFDDYGNLKEFVQIQRDITAKLKIENELKVKEEMLSIITENAFDFIWTLDMNLNIKYASKSVVNLLEYSIEEIQGMNTKYLYSDNEFKRIEQILNSELSKGSPHEGVKFTAKHLKKDGSEIPVEIRARIIYNEEGQPLYIQGYTHDIKEQKNAEENVLLGKYYLDFLNTISKEQANTTNSSDLISLILEQLKSISKGIFVTFSEYDASDKNLKNLKFTASQPIIETVVNITGKKILNTEVPVDDKYYKEIITERIKSFPNLYEDTNGAISPVISSLIQKALGIDKIWGLSYIIDKKLYGTSIFALKKGQKEPKAEILESFINISSISLRRLLLEKQLRESEGRFRSIFEQSTMGIYRTTPEGEILMANPSMIKMLGYKTFEEIKDWNLNDSDFEPEYDRTEFIKIMNDKNKITGREALWTKRDGTKLYVRESAMTIRNENGQIKYYQGMVEDLSEQKQIKQELLQIENESKKYLDAINSMDLGLFIVNQDYSIRYMNDTMIKWFGDQTNLICYKSVAGLNEPCSYCRLMEVIDTGKNVTYTPTTEDGRTFNIHGSLLHNADGTVSKLELIQDITELTSTHKYVKNLLAEKNIILKEVHHRIKNNMMTIMGLLTFQEQSLTDKKSIEAFENTRNRVQSMMILYDKLYKSSEYQSVWIKDYIGTLLEEIIDGFSGTENIQLEYNIEDIKMESKIVFNLGIIINELITNSIKYAVNKAEQKGLSISVSASSLNNRVIFIIKDNGQGYPDHKSQNDFEGFGLKLVKILTEQISAKVSFSNDNGAKVKISL